jgi:hypothetical protein
MVYDRKHLSTLEPKPVRVAVWNEGESFFWDDAEDHGGFDRCSPHGAFATRGAACEDARVILSPFPVIFEDGPPSYYGDGE